MQKKYKIIEIGKKFYDKGFVSAYDGNISLRNDNSSFYITRTAKCKGELDLNDIVVIDYDGNLISGEHRPSTEYKIHSIYYQNRQDINAVIHAHPVYSSVLAVINIDRIEVQIFPEVYLNIGEVGICEYQTPSTKELAQSLLKHIDKNVVILQNHGIVVAGRNIEEAYFRLEKFEHFAKIYTEVLKFGNINKLSEQQLEHLKIIAQTVYKS
ncbi:MAG TPA: class II aldolase/adducin family protein [Ignavibacteriales bacterium]|nr:class II aldolase/adducin family protein [Ignavibacteriales bacterium]